MIPTGGDHDTDKVECSYIAIIHDHIGTKHDIDTKQLFVSGHFESDSQHEPRGGYVRISYQSKVYQTEKIII